MSFIVLVESLKFYKLRRVWLPRLLFLGLILVSLLPYAYPQGLEQFNRFFEQSMNFVQAPTSEQLNRISAMANRDLGIFIGLQLLSLVGAFALIYFYAAAYYAERQGLDSRLGLWAMLRARGQLYFFLLLVFSICCFSAWMFFLPGLVLLLIWGYSPLCQAEAHIKRRLEMEAQMDEPRTARAEAAEDKAGQGHRTAAKPRELPPLWPRINSENLEQLPPHLRQRFLELQHQQSEFHMSHIQALRLSYHMSRGRRIYFLLSGMAIYFLVARFGPALAQLMQLEGLTYSLVAACFYSLYALMLARLLGLYYFISREQLRPDMPSLHSMEDFYQLVTGEEPPSRNR